MSGDGNSKKLSAFQRLNRMGAASLVSFDEHGLKDGLWRIAHAHYLSDEDFKLVASAASALDGTHPDLRLTLEEIPEDVTPRRLGEWARRAKARRVADFIDMLVADGAKQESAVQEALDRFTVSRREAFRMLKEVRADRLLWLDWDGYDDYAIQDDGRLVPR